VANPKRDKGAVVDEVRQRLESADGVVVTEYRGLSVKAMSGLRRELRPIGGSYKVYKNTLVRRAASDLGLELDQLLVGPTALAFTDTTPNGEAGDVVAVAKVMRDFARTNPALVVKGGLLSGRVLDAGGVGALADVEPREVLLARLAGAFAAPMQQFAGLLQALPRNFAYGLKALLEQGGASGSSPAGTSDTSASDSGADAPSVPDADADTVPVSVLDADADADAVPVSVPDADADAVPVSVPDADTAIADAVGAVTAGAEALGDDTTSETTNETNTDAGES
jgi:large subunit ribosomal protein L10